MFPLGQPKQNPSRELQECPTEYLSQVWQLGTKELEYLSTNNHYCDKQTIILPSQPLTKRSTRAGIKHQAM